MARVIMTVDDSDTIREIVSSVLRNAGYKVIEAADGRDALTKLGGQRVHMIFSDLNMPNLDGIGLTREIRATPATRFLPVVMLTTESDESIRREGREAGVTGWIVKPFQAEQLIVAARRVLG